MYWVDFSNSQSGSKPEHKKIKGVVNLHDIYNVLQVLSPFIMGVLAWILSNKKSDRDYIKDENDRLLKRIDTLTKRVDDLTAENDRLRKELLDKKG